MSTQNGLKTKGKTKTLKLGLKKILKEKHHLDPENFLRYKTISTSSQSKNIRITSNAKMSVEQMKQSTECRDYLQNGRRYLSNHTSSKKLIRSNTRGTPALLQEINE